jgi:hypothetical protein
LKWGTPAPAVEENPDGTSISVGKDGIDVSTKNGSNETNVTVGAGDASVELRNNTNHLKINDKTSVSFMLALLVTFMKKKT